MQGLLKTSVWGFILVIIIIWGINYILSPSFPATYSLDNGSIEIPGQPEGYHQSGHVDFNVNTNDDNFVINYSFKDHKSNQWEWEWGYPKDTTVKMVHQFGIPDSTYKNAQTSEAKIQELQKAIDKGMFRIDDGYIVPDRNAIIDYYWDYMGPLENLTEQTLGKKQTFRNRLEFILKFVQDIPYGTPPKQFNTKIINGILPPPMLLVNMFGDCDSKALLFAGIVAHFNIYDIAFFKTPNHLLVGVAGIPKPYDTYHTYKNQKYILADVVGPSRTDLGQIKRSYGRVSKVEKLTMN